MEKLGFGDAFLYPFRRPVGMLNILWFFVPVFGWFALVGYLVRILNEFVDGDFVELPFIELVDDFKLGFMIFIKMLPFLVVLFLFNLFIPLIPIVGFLGYLFVNFFIVPVLSVNFVRKQTVASYFEFSVAGSVFENFGDYMLAFIKQLGLSVIFYFMIFVIVGFPALYFTMNIFIADFYRRNVELGSAKHKATKKKR